jgi:hypothetical protein
LYVINNRIMDKEKLKNKKTKGERLGWKSSGKESLDLEKRLKNVVIGQPQKLSEQPFLSFLIP